MALFEQFPYTNFHGVNLSWILDTIRDHETRIHSLEDWKIVTDGRLDSLEGRMTTAEGDIDALEGRMTTAEGDIDDLEAHDLLLIEYDKTDIPDPYDYKDAILGGRRAVLHAKFGSNDYYLPLYQIISASSRCYLYFLDVAGEVSSDINDQASATHFCAVELRNSNALGAPAWFGGSL